MRILIIVPAFNEAAIIADTLSQIRRAVPAADILAISDASTDATESEIRKTGAAYLTLPVNLGIGGAVQCGYLYAREHGYDCAVQVDGDGQHDPAYIPPMLKWMEREHLDVCIGSRFLDKEGFRSSLFRRAGISFLSFLLRVLYGVKIRDVTSGLRAVNRRFIEVFAEDYSDDYPETDSLTTVLLSGGLVAEYPVVMRPRTTGKSSISPAGSVYYMLKVSASVLLSRLTHRKARGKAAEGASAQSVSPAVPHKG